MAVLGASRGAWARSLLVSLVVLLGCCGAQAGPNEATGIESVRKLLAAGQAAEALTAAYAALEGDIEDVALLQLASEAAEKAGRADEALWLAQLSLRAAFKGASPGPLQRALVARARALDPLPEAERPALEGHARQLFDLGQLCVKRKLYANAVDFFERCGGTAMAVSAAEQTEKLYANAKAVDAMLASGIDVPLRPSRTRSAQRLAKEDAQHATWDKAWKIKGENYTVETNAGWELGTAVLDALEQINRYYRVVFQHKLRGGSTARCTIRLYATRKEFEEHEHEEDPSVAGFYSPDNYVACYDPRSIGDSLTDLWETLFHEASHQFTHMISTGKIPGWLDEGTATYFEGTRRRANGRVESNLAHEGRLRNLKEVLEKGTPTVRQVVAYYGDGSYPGDYYPVGGYLVYFFKNYEDESCQRVYSQYFDAYMRSYRTGGQHDPFERFVEYFIDKPKQPGVTTFEQFEQRFKTWCLDLYDLQFGPPERADLLLQRADRQRAAGQLDAAMDSYRWALAKRTDDVRALLAMAEIHAERKEEDAAVYRYRQLVEIARSVPDATAPLAAAGDLTAAALLDRCSAAITGFDKFLGGAVLSADGKFVAEIRQAAEKYLEAGFPRCAAWLLDTASTSVGGFPALEDERQAVEVKHSVQACLWRRLPLDLESWSGRGAWRAEGDGLVGTGDGKRASAFLLRDPMPERYRVEVTITFRGKAAEDPLAGVLFGIDEGGVWDLLAANGKGGTDVSRCDDDWTVFKVLPALNGGTAQPFKLGLEVGRGQVRFFVQGKHVHTQPYPPAELRGRLGLLVQDIEASFTAIRVAY